MRTTLFRRLAVMALVLGGTIPAWTHADELIRSLDSQGYPTAAHRKTGMATFIGSPPGRPLPAEAVGARLAPGEAAGPDQFVRTLGASFGLGRADEARSIRDRLDADGKRSTRYRQHHKGVPVFAGELIVNLDARGNMLSMVGRAAPALDLDVRPTLGADDAAKIALAAAAKWHRVAPAQLAVGTPELSVYDPRLLDGGGGFPAALVWRAEVRSTALAPIRHLVLVDAASGGIRLSFNQVHEARNRMTYTANSTAARPGALECDEANDPCIGGVSDAVDAHRFGRDTYDFFMTHHGRDSIDNAGMPIVSTVLYCPDSTLCPYQNAFWDGFQMTYGQGFAASDDVVAHEITHGVTERESGLFYYYQSGAINESFSDIWGELVDQLNGRGTDTPAVAWLMGEDIPVFGAIRNMADPTLFNDPDRMRSPLYFTGRGDNGGVHINSGINNKAAYLIWNGGTFNGRSVAGLGPIKTSRIYYRAQTALLVSGSDYFDLYHALLQACNDLIGTAGIRELDCNSVRNAVDAVEMNLEPVAGFNTDAGFCPAGQSTRRVLFSDNFEAGGFSSRWSASAGLGSFLWGLFSGYATSGELSMFGPDADSPSDVRITLNTPISIPPSTPAQLHFRHAFGFEMSTNSSATNFFWDGGVLEYSIDGGTTWVDANSLRAEGPGYKGTLQPGTANPLAGRSAFVGDSHGYVSTRYNLATLAGTTVQFRLRVATDDIIGARGWFVDDFSIRVCDGPPAAPLPPQPRRLMDFNGDGKADMLWLKLDGSIAQWLMSSSLQIGGVGLIGGGTGWMVTHTGDFNGDGKTDLLWAHSDGRASMWLMNGSSQIGGAGLIGAGTGWSAKLVADFDGDGRSDILWQRNDGRAALWMMNGAALRQAVAATNGASDWRPMLAGDFNRDGRSDIVWQHLNGSVVLNLMNGGGLIDSALLIGPSQGSPPPGGPSPPPPPFPPPFPPPGWTPKLAADLNGDGFSDLIWVHSDGRAAAWLMSGIQQAGGALLVGPGSGLTPEWAADVNGDLSADIFWRGADQSVTLWLMSGATVAAIQPIFGASSGWTVRRVTDFNGDGRADFVASINSASGTRMWLWNGSTFESAPVLENAGTPSWQPIQLPN